MAPALPVFDPGNIDEELVAAISTLLTQNGVPCVLWGNYLLTVYGVPTIISAIDFVVPDTCIAQAASILLSSGQLFECSNPKTCGAVAERRPSPTPTSHFHFDSVTDFVLSLHLQSSTLWFLAPLIINEKPEGDLMTASDHCLLPKRPERGPGAFRDTTPAVYIPTAHRLLESYLRSIAKDPDGKSAGFFLSMVIYIEMYVDKDGLLEHKNIEGRCREFYEAYKKIERPIRVLLDELVAAFAEPADPNL